MTGHETALTWPRQLEKAIRKDPEGEVEWKGSNVVNKYKNIYRFNEKVQKRQCYNLKKNKNFDQKKQLISTYVASVIGALQCLEQQLFYMMDQAEQSNTNSMIRVVGQLTNFIEF
ncbi:Uncharacterized protein FWK35_00017618 [Aphis craccivora]|uniref:Uncharacterized protein n=1 Tax=Aphis craccivora TaxID=307492 RepID=A0A6G0YM82_APHCR|nr:Uncharacterized protein FWK35_00017618 [Aphis craccivora]